MVLALEKAGDWKAADSQLLAKAVQGHSQGMENDFNQMVVMLIST